MAVLAVLVIFSEVGLSVEIHNSLDPPVSTGIISTLGMATVFGFTGYVTEGSWRGLRVGVAVAIVLGVLMAALLGFGMWTQLGAFSCSWGKTPVGSEQDVHWVRLVQCPPPVVEVRRQSH